jgi:hypothetical protein
LQKKKEQETIAYTSEKIELNEEGLVNLPKKYLKIKHAVAPLRL